jgi:signal transduction histidine kinase
LLAVSIIPLIIFSIREKTLLFTGLTINFIVLMLLDPVMYYFSKEQSVEPYTFSAYLSNNFIILIAYSFLTGSVTFLKNLFEHFEHRNESLILRLNQKNDELEGTNRELYKLNQEIETQNEEMQAQSEELLQSQESLMAAHQEIERQKLELEIKNHQLEQTLDEKSRDLLITNQQLVTQNNELQQFSYTVSHNLRGPVASMLGLINIHRLSKSDEERATVLNLLTDSAVSLETIIKDLNKIIDIRNDKFSVMEKVNLKAELDLIIQSLKTFIDENRVTIRSEFHHPEIVSVKAYINSILYNLISNALQYRSPDRLPIIQVSSHKKGEHVVIEVADNGLGIDLEKYRGDMFKLYKRFHNHIQGKGLGLYLVRQQVEKLDGHIEVDSTPDQGTTFRVYHKLSS